MAVVTPDLPDIFEEAYRYHSQGYPYAGDNSGLVVVSRTYYFRPDFGLNSAYFFRLLVLLKLALGIN